MAKKPDFLFRQAGGLPYLQDGVGLEIVLITSRSSGKWIFPKGVIDPGETPESTAVKEAQEEAGVVGRITGEALGTYEQEKWGGLARIDIYPLAVESLLEEWEEQATRERLVVGFEEARQLLAPSLAEILDALLGALQTDCGG